MMISLQSLATLLLFCGTQAFIPRYELQARQLAVVNKLQAEGGRPFDGQGRSSSGSTKRQYSDDSSSEMYSEAVFGAKDYEIPTPPRPVHLNHNDPTMENLAKSWTAMNRDTDTFVQPPPLSIPPIPEPSPTIPEPVLEQYSGPSMEDLAREWSMTNRNVDDSFVNNPSMTTTQDTAYAPVSPVVEPITISEPPMIDFDWESLAEAWASTNRDTDTAYMPMPSLDAFGPAASADRSGSSLTDASIQPALDQLEESWSSIADELEEANREAQDTFQVLQQMEDEMNRLMEELMTKEASYQQKLQQLQEAASKKEKHLHWQLETLETEYVAFKHDARERHLATVREAEESQLKLESKIAELKTSLDEKINLARQESQLAQQYLQQFQEAESRYTLAKEEHQDEMKQTVIRLQPSTERLDKLRSLTETLRGVSRGSNGIMVRIRQKLAGNE